MAMELGQITAGTIDLDFPYFLFFSQKWSAASPHPGCVNLAKIIYV